MTKLENREKGSMHWILQRASAVAMIPLGIWLTVSLVQLPFSSFATVQKWLNSSVSAFLLALMVLITIYHATVGMQQIYKDYVHQPILALLAKTITNALALVLAIVVILSIYDAWKTAL